MSQITYQGKPAELEREVGGGDLIIVQGGRRLAVRGQDVVFLKEPSAAGAAAPASSAPAADPAAPTAPDGAPAPEAPPAP